MVSLFSNSAMVRGRDEVYVAAMPLRATKGPPQLLMSAAYSLNFWDLQHFMVIIKPSSPSQVLVFDFQPKDPEDIYVALAALYGRAVPVDELLQTRDEILFLLHKRLLKEQQRMKILADKHSRDVSFDIGSWVFVKLGPDRQITVSGAVLVRKLKKLPRNKCWLVGYSTEDAVEIAREFNKKWETNLTIGLHDCRDYTNSLVRQLTGEKDMLKRLRNLGS